PAFPQAAAPLGAAWLRIPPAERGARGNGPSGGRVSNTHPRWVLAAALERLDPARALRLLGRHRDHPDASWEAFACSACGLAHWRPSPDPARPQRPALRPGVAARHPAAARAGGEAATLWSDSPRLAGLASGPGGDDVLAGAAAGPGELDRLAVADLALTESRW